MTEPERSRLELVVGGATVWTSPVVSGSISRPEAGEEFAVDDKPYRVTHLGFRYSAADGVGTWVIYAQVAPMKASQ